MALISGLEEPLEEGTTTRCSILVWRIPWTEEPGALQSTGSQRVRQDQSDLAQPSMLCKSQIGALLVFRVYLNTALGRSWGNTCRPLALCAWSPPARASAERAGGSLAAAASHLTCLRTARTEQKPRGCREPSGFSLPASQTQGRHHGALDPERSPVLWGGFL